jgi:CHAT domain-containing protein
VQNSSDAKALLKLGNAYLRLKKYDEALDYYERAYTFFEKNNDRPRQGISLNNIGFVRLRSNNFTSAEKSFRQTISIWESLRPGLKDENKVALFETQTTTYNFLQQTLVAQKLSEAALEVSEQGRGRAFVELLAKRLNSQPSSNNNQASAKPPNIQQIKQIVRDQKVTLVQYSIVNNETLYIWVVQPTGEIVFRPVELKSFQQPSAAITATKPTESTEPQLSLGKSPTELVSLVRSTRSSMGVLSAGTQSDPNPQTKQPLAFQSDPSEMGRQLKRLHELLITPIADLLPTDPNQPVIFIPQGALFLVPFPALRDANGTYLIEKHTILTALSIQVLDLTRQQKSKLFPKGNALIVGNPVMPKDLAALPAAETEAKAIAPLFNTQPLIGTQGTCLFS